MGKTVPEGRYLAHRGRKDVNAAESSSDCIELTPGLMPWLYDTGFGLLKLERLRIAGGFMFRPQAERLRQQHVLSSSHVEVRKNGCPKCH